MTPVVVVTKADLAADAGALDADRLRRWRKLAAGEAFNTESLSRCRARDRAFGRMARRAIREKQSRRDE